MKTVRVVPRAPSREPPLTPPHMRLAGDLITEQGSEGSRIYIILSGECDVFKQSGYGGFAERTAWGVPVNTLPAGAVT